VAVGVGVRVGVGAGVESFWPEDDESHPLAITAANPSTAQPTRNLVRASYALENRREFRRFDCITRITTAHFHRKRSPESQR